MKYFYNLSLGTAFSSSNKLNEVLWTKWITEIDLWS